MTFRFATKSSPSSSPATKPSPTPSPGPGISSPRTPKPPTRCTPKSPKSSAPATPPAPPPSPTTPTSNTPSRSSPNPCASTPRPGPWADAPPKPVELGPYRLPPGAHFFFSQYVMHRSPEFWDDPLTFRPERHTPRGQGRSPPLRLLPLRRRPPPVHRRRLRLDGRRPLPRHHRSALASHLRPHLPRHPPGKITLRPKHPMIMRVDPT